MSFETIAAKYPKDNKFLPRTHELNLLLRVVAPDLQGGIYDLPKGSRHLYPFHQELTGAGTYITLINRRPNVPEGTNLILQCVLRQASMVFGADRFPAVETANEEARSILTAFIDEAEIEDRARECVVLGSVGSVAQHIRVLAPPGGNARIYVDNYPTNYLTPTFDPHRPDQLIKIVEKYRINGRALRENGYVVADEDLNKQFWFMRQWDTQSEIWFVPWSDEDEKEDGFSPSIDKTPGRTTEHNLGFCPWIWIKNLPIGHGVDGTCQFRAALDHAINLDYLESQIVAAVKYTMSPTLVIETPPAAPAAPNSESTDGQTGFANTPGKILVIDASGKAYYVEISGSGIEACRQVADDLRKAIKLACHGDMVDPEKVIQGHQGAKSIAMMNQAMIGLCDQLRSNYGTALKRLLKMVLRIISLRAGHNMGQVEINDQLVDVATLGKVTDLSLSFGDYYDDTPAELHASAQAMDLNLKNGLVSEERAMSKLARSLNIPNVADEQIKVAADQNKNDARAIRLAEAAAQVKVMENIPNS